MNLKSYVLELTKKLTLFEANQWADGFYDYYLEKGLRIFYKILTEGKARVSKIVFYREIDREDFVRFREELKLKYRLTGLKAYKKGEVIQARQKLKV